MGDKGNVLSQSFVIRSGGCGVVRVHDSAAGAVQTDFTASYLQNTFAENDASPQCDL